METIWIWQYKELIELISAIVTIIGAIISSLIIVIGFIKRKTIIPFIKKIFTNKSDTILIHNKRTGGIKYIGGFINSNEVKRVDRKTGEQLMKNYPNGVIEIKD